MMQFLGEFGITIQPQVLPCYITLLYNEITMFHCDMIKFIVVLTQCYPVIPQINCNKTL